MSFKFSELIEEVKARSVLNKAGTRFDTRIENIINTSIFRLSREAFWRVLRRKTTFETEAEYSTGSGSVSVTNGSKSVTVTGATLITDGIEIGRRVDLGGSALNYEIVSITGETTFTVNVAYDGTTSSAQTYKIYGRGEYNLPIQTGRIATVWHEDFGSPFVMRYMTDQDFLHSNTSFEQGDTPIVWRQWSVDHVIQQPIEASVLRVYSSASADQNVEITVFGTVSGYPDFETIITNSSDGTTAVSGTKSFTTVERITKSKSTTGRITIDSNSANVTVAVLPVGDSTGSVEYKKIQIFPFPNRVFPINVYYYKDPWRLVNSNDVSELGHQFDEAIILLTTAKLNYNQSKKEGDKFLALYMDEVKNLRRNNADAYANYKPTLRTPYTVGRGTLTGNPNLSYNQLGGYYGPRVI